MNTSTASGDKIKLLLEQIAQGDKQLYEEIQSRKEHASVQEKAALLKEENLVESFNETLGDEAELEAVILTTGRPVLFVRSNEADTGQAFEEPESEVWRGKLVAANAMLKQVIPAIGRIEIQNHPRLDWAGTGWLVDDDIVVTNRHVAELFAFHNGAGFEFRQSFDGSKMSGSIDLLEEEGSFDERILRLTKVLHIEPEPGADMAFFRAVPVSGGMPAKLILDTSAMSGTYDVATIGYPGKDSRMPDVALMEKLFGNVFGKKRLAPGQVNKTDSKRLYHDCSTLGGCSGAAVLNLQSGKVAGLHFAGRFLDSNFAVPATVVAERLQKIKGGTAAPKKPAPAKTAETKEDTTQAAATTLQAAGSAVSFIVPLHITVSLGGNGAATVTAASTPPPVIPSAPAAPAAAADDPDELITEARVEDYTDRKGYDEDFLGDGFKVPLPKVTGEKRKKDVLTYDNNGKKDHVLRYQHFSVVMSRNRRQCIFSAVNINGAKKQKVARTTWRTDPRIPKEAQIIKECYGSPPKYSRGHMTRREDPVWGTAAQALRGNDDSMHVTNATPQMQSFNAPVWLALEDYALSNAREDKMSISVFTGPVFQPNDPVQFGVKIPKRFWKIIAFIHDETGELCATGYMMSQEDHIPDVEFVFGEFGTAQVSIASIEKATGLSFGKLASVDPMNNESAADPVRPLTSAREMKF